MFVSHEKISLSVFSYKVILNIGRHSPIETDVDIYNERIYILK